MKGKRLTAVLAAILALAAVGAGTAAATGAFSSHRSTRTERALSAALHDRAPKNVIFLLGDGMGTQEITAARYYQGVSKELNVDRMPFTGFDTTWSLKPAASAPYLPDYDPDSASTGTMWADRAEDARRAHLPGAQQRHQRPRAEPDDGAGAGAEKGHEGG
jgi:alkaline phosphatase/streptomycin-6-phosphatase